MGEDGAGSFLGMVGKVFYIVLSRSRNIKPH